MQQTARPFPTTGGDNGDGTPVVECTAPQFDAAGQPVEQLQCYCTTGTCGAGLLDAGAAVRAVRDNAVIASGRARIDLEPRQAVAGSPVRLVGTSSIAPTGRPIVGYQWALVDGGGIVGTVNDATQSTATVVPAGPGRFKVRLTVQDSGGGLSTADLTVAVNAAEPAVPGVEPPPSAADTGGGGGGGGALGLPWLLALAAAALARRRRS
jgi:serine protease